MDFKKMTTAQALGTIVGRIAVWFVSAAFIWWGLECFRMAFQSAAVWIHGSLCHADGSLSSHGDFLAD
jgi:hypothetical protein